MATVNTVSGDQAISGNQQISGNLTVLGIITGQRRSALTADTSQSYMLPLQNFRIWDEFDRPLPDTTATSGLIVAQLRYDATIADTVFFVANRDYRVVGMTGRVEVAGTGGACTAVIKKAASATAIASGTALHSSTFNLVGTAATNQVLTVSTTLTVLAIPSGTCIGFDLTGTPTTAVGTISVYLIPISPDDLAITSGAFATGFPYIHTGDLKTQGATSRYARTTFTLPPEYQAGQAFSIRLACGMLTTVADTSATALVEAYKTNRDTTKTGSNLVTTSATTINSLTFADRSFSLSSGSLVAGDVLDIRLTLAVNDGATVTVVDAAVVHVEALLTIQG